MAGELLREVSLATTAKIEKWKRKPKYKVQFHNRCQLCGRPRGYIRKFGLCRICFRGLALKGEVPGVTKSSW
jgi:small subunit ribosomal protein S14